MNARFFDYYKKCQVVSDFKDKRYYGLHEGIDYSGTKTIKVNNCLDGVLYKQYYNQYSGHTVILQHNTKYFGFDFEELFFTMYCHLFRPDKIDRYFVPCGTELGYFGNSGKTLTRHNENGTVSKEYRDVTTKEQENEFCDYGVHLHYSIFQGLNSGLFIDAIKCDTMTQKMNFDGMNRNWLFINPKQFMNKLEGLQK